MTRVLIVDSNEGIRAGLLDAIAKRGNGEIVVIDYKTGESEMRNRMGAMAVALASAFGVLGEAGRSAGESVMRFMAASSPGPTFGQRYGANPRSTGNGGQGRGTVARMKRAARTRRNIAARSSKRRHG